MPEVHSVKTRARFTWQDLVVLVAFECIAVPICIAAGDAFVREEYGRAVFGWAIGIPLAIAGFTAHWWKDWLTESTRERIQRNANRWGPVAILLAFLYVAGPDIYRRATELASPAVTSVPAGQSAAPPAAPRPVTSQPAIHAKVYSESEKEDLRNAMREIAKIVDGQGNDVSMKIEEVLRSWDFLYSTNNPSTISTLLQKFDNLQNSISVLKNSLDRQDSSVMNQYRSYSEEIVSVLDLPQP